MAWNTADNTWSSPGGWQTPAWDTVFAQFNAENPDAASATGQQRAKKFIDWWNRKGSSLIGNAWETANTAWQQTYDAWLADPDRTSTFQYTGSLKMPELPPALTMPDAIDFSGINAWREQQLYGVDDLNTPQDESQTGIYDIIENILNELGAGAAQYNDEWLDQYAAQAGFTDPEAREAWLSEARAQQQRYMDNQTAMLENLQNNRVTEEQQKAIRQAMVDQEAQARRQAERSYQETGSYATLQRASDEINRSQVADTVKMQMEMALQNFSAAQSAVGQQTDVLMREVEAGTKSFNDYVNAKQFGLNAALSTWQQRAANVLSEAQQRVNELQQQYQNAVTAAQGQYAADMQQYEAQVAAYEADYARQLAEFNRTQDFVNAQGELILAAWAQALGYGTALEATNAYYNAYIQPMIDQWEAEVIPEGQGPDSKGVINPNGGADDVLGWGSAVLGAGMIILGTLAAIFSWGTLAPIAGGLVTGGVGLLGTGMVGVTRD